MSRDEMLAQVRARHEAKSGYSYKIEDAELAIDEGLVDGDVVHLGGKLYGHIHGDDVAMINDKVETARMSLTMLSQEQRDMMLVLKAVRASRTGHTIGRP